MPQAQNIVITDGTTPVTLSPRSVGDTTVFTSSDPEFIAREQVTSANRLATRQNNVQKTRIGYMAPVVGTVDGETQELRRIEGSVEIRAHANSTSSERTAYWEKMESLFADANLKQQFVEGEKFFG